MVHKESFDCLLFNDTATTDIYTYCHTLSLHDALPISAANRTRTAQCRRSDGAIVSSSECTSRGISLSQSETAPNYSGCSFSVSFGAWSGWSSSCSASASRTRTATCRRSDGGVVANSGCDRKSVGWGKGGTVGGD